MKEQISFELILLILGVFVTAIGWLFVKVYENNRHNAVQDMRINKNTDDYKYLYEQLNINYQRLSDKIDESIAQNENYHQIMANSFMQMANNKSIALEDIVKKATDAINSIKKK